MPQGFSRLLPVLMTLAVVGVVGFWAWNGLKSPPLSQSRGIITTPAGWQRIDEGSFSLYAPKGSAIRQAEQGGLTYGDILGPNTCLNYRVGAKAAIVADRRTHARYTETPMTVDGHQGVLRKAVLNDTERYQWFSQCNGTIYIGLLVPHALSDGASLAIEGTALSEDERDQIETIFKSVRFASK